MTNFKITVTKIREGSTGNIDYTKEKLSEFAATLVFGKEKKSMGDMVTPYSYEETEEYIVDELEKAAKISEIKAMLSGHIVFTINVEETSKQADTNYPLPKNEEEQKRADFNAILANPADDDLLETMNFYDCDEIEMKGGMSGESTIYKRSEIGKYTASLTAKKEGLPSLKIAAEISGESAQTLNNWFNNKHFVFDAVIAKASEQYKKEA